jgi:hypothetical protein
VTFADTIIRRAPVARLGTAALRLAAYKLPPTRIPSHLAVAARWFLRSPDRTAVDSVVIVVVVVVVVKTPSKL